MSARPVVDVAVGVLFRADGRFLLASRPEGKPYPHYWEFPGGKLESGEAVATALARELHEELGIDIGAAQPWVVREFDYPHAYVRLHFCRVRQWRGEPHAREGQAFRFCALDDLPAPLLPATLPVLRWLDLPPVYALSDATRLGADRFLARLQRQLASGLRLLQFREPELDARSAEPIFRETLARVRAAGGRLLVSSRHPMEWSDAADGVHLTARDLDACIERPQGAWLGASVHDSDQLERAAALGVDLAVFGPVRETASHPGQPGIGWARFSAVAAHASVPLFAIGGLASSDLAQAEVCGAHGIALQRAAWPGN
ncbi:MAG TPA: Nudix family hydrolase [Burkholderiaceae bacterium]|nr:Nudix family hydrolase [Burkholderiaceae bacterium]